MKRQKFLWNFLNCLYSNEPLSFSVVSRANNWKFQWHVHLPIPVETLSSVVPQIINTAHRLSGCLFSFNSGCWLIPMASAFLLPGQSGCNCIYGGFFLKMEIANLFFKRRSSNMWYLFVCMEICRFRLWIHLEFLLIS